MSNHQYRALFTEALVVDDVVAGRDSFRQWKFEYRRLEDYLSPEPVPFGNNQNRKVRGVWLRWVLPKDLRTQREDGSFPLIPNRYLIERYETKTGERKNWVLECDCPLGDVMEDAQYEKIMPYTTQYLVDDAVIRSMQTSGDPYRESVYAGKSKNGPGWYVNLGVPFAGEIWEERGRTVPFLTACAPGNPDFSGYVPHNSGILSFFDDLKDCGDQTLCYSVIGWHTDPLVRVYYSGQVFGVPWKKEGWTYQAGKEDPYRDELGQKLRAGNVNAAIGENGAEAFRAWFVHMFLAGRDVSKEQENELEWLLCAVMEGKEQDFSEADGGRKLRDQLQRRRFEEQYGGTEQTAPLDREIGILKSLRQELQTVWWKRGYVSGFSKGVGGKHKEDYDVYFNMEDENSLLRQTIRQYEKVKELWKESGKESGNESDNRSDKEKPQQSQQKAPGRYWKPADPYLILYGIRQPLDSEQDAPVRDDSQLYTGTQQPEPDIRGELADGVKKLYQETQMLLAGFLQGSIPQNVHPGYPVEAWHQPWRPAFLEWRAGYEQISSFVFNGYEYVTDTMGKPDLLREESFGGRMTLDGHRRDAFAKMLDQIGEQTGTEALQKAADVVKKWELMGQSLSGFTQQMAQRDTKAFVRPPREIVPGTSYLLTEILGYEDPDEEFFNRTAEAAQSVPCVQDQTIPKFRITQGGRCCLRDLVLYDAFGRELVLIASKDGSGCYSSANFPLIVSGEMRGLQEENHHGFLLRPAILQESRLSVSLEGEHGKPFFGLLVLDYFGHSLLVFSPEGEALGELIPLAAESGERVVSFIGFADSGYEPEQIRQEYPLLWNFIQALAGRPAQAFEQMSDQIDRAFWMMEAAGADKKARLALLRGRPLALSRMPVYVERYGLERTDAGWEGGDEKKFRGIRFPFCIGEGPLREDGVAGYFEDDKFTQFHSVFERDARLNTGFEQETAAAPYVLYDPLLSIHVYTGILPVKRTGCRKKEVLDLLGQMKIRFPAGPVARGYQNGKAGTVREGCFMFADEGKEQIGGSWNE